MLRVSLKKGVLIDILSLRLGTRHMYRQTQHLLIVMAN